MGITYDDYGQVTKTTLTNSTDSAQMESKATYSGGLLRNETDLTGAQTTYGYNAKRQNVTVKNAKDITIESHPDDVWNRTDRTYQANYVSANFGYTDGNLTQIARGGYLVSGDGNKKTQNYLFTYDVYGNRTSTSIGDIVLASYSYNANNGTLSSMTYGPQTAPLAAVTYGYDQLDRVKDVTYSDYNSGTSVTYGYDYSADGAIAGIRENSVLKYSATYDSLGRLIYSAKLEGGTPVLYTSHQYDTSNRIKSQKWQMGNQSFYETYTYNNTDGTLQSVVLSGETLGFSYGSLKQLIKRTSPKVDTTYSYTTNSSGNLTNRVGTIQYLKPGTSSQLMPSLEYSYDQLGNITGVKEKNQAGISTSAASYGYDVQNQLISETLKNQSQTYSYDTYGNIRSKTVSKAGSVQERYNFSYENSSWLDQLSEVSYTGSNGSTVTKPLTYDAIGNPLSYFNGKKEWNFTWKNGRQLSTATSGTTTITNSYDAEGVRESKTVKSGSSANTLYGKNALKYRGYYYDADLGMYYLGSRFYDPEICRFVNADGQLNMSANLLGVNQYTYCVNNPVVYVDESGTRPVAGISLEDETATERKASFEQTNESVKLANENKRPDRDISWLMIIGITIISLDDCIGIGVLDNFLYIPFIWLLE